MCYHNGSQRQVARHNGSLCRVARHNGSLRQVARLTGRRRFESWSPPIHPRLSTTLHCPLLHCSAPHPYWQRNITTDVISTCTDEILYNRSLLFYMYMYLERIKFEPLKTYNYARLNYDFNPVSDLNSILALVLITAAIHGGLHVLGKKMITISKRTWSRWSLWRRRRRRSRPFCVSASSSWLSSRASWWSRRRRRCRRRARGRARRRTAATRVVSAAAACPGGSPSRSADRWSTAAT